MYFSLQVGDIPNFINNSLRSLFAFLCEFIYPLIADMYSIFSEMGTIVYQSGFNELYRKISLIIGIFMVFRVTFWLIELLINPDGIKDKEKNPGNIIKKVLISVVLLAVTPTIFEYANVLQVEIINSGIIEKIFAVDKITDEEDTGNRLAADLFINFYTVNIEDSTDSCVTSYAGKDGTIYQELRNNGEMNYLNNSCLTKVDDVKKNDKEVYLINFNGIFATAVGGFVLWMLLMYCIEVGTRFVQLVYLQVIAPVPIMCYLVPGKDNMFTKWVKQCTTTYLDLFIRIVIINFVMLLCGIILDNDTTFIKNFNEANWIIEVFLVLGLLTFAKKAPSLIAELIPMGSSKASGDFGLSLKKKTDNMLGGKTIYNTAKRAPGYAIGGALGGIIGGVMGAAGGKGAGSRIMGTLTGAARGFGTGSKKGNVIKNLGDVKKNQAAQNSKLQQWRIDAGKGDNDPNTFADWWSRKQDATRQAMGFETQSKYLDRAKSSAQSVSGVFKDQKEEGISKVLENGANSNGGTRATSLGIGGTLLERDQRRKTTQAALQENDKNKLLSTTDGNSKLEAFLTGAGSSWATSHGITATVFSSLSSTQREMLANEYINSLQAEENAAQQDYRDSEKQFSFIYAIEQAAGIKRDDATGDITSIDARNANEKNLNNWAIINEFISSYDEQYGITVGDNPLFEFGTKKFDPIEMANLVRRAESGDTVASDRLKKMYKDYDKIKTLMSRVDSIERGSQATTSRANDKFNSGK